MNNKLPLVFAMLLEMGIFAYASDTGSSEFSGKRIAIIYEDERMPVSLFDKAYQYFSELTQTGELKTVEIGNNKNVGKIINIQTPTDDRIIAGYEHIIVKNKVEEKIQKNNLPYTARFQIFSKNIMFGDKSLGYVVNPYRGCYDHTYLAQGFIDSGYQLVEANDNPDAIIKIGIDVCMTENEFKEYIQKNTALKVTKQPTTSKEGDYSIGNDLIRAGTNVQLGTPNGSDNAGLAVAGVGLALNVANWMMTKTPQERDIIRYHVTFSGKDKLDLDYYPLIITNNTHKEGETVHYSSYREIEKLVFQSFFGWNMASNTFGNALPPLSKEKDILKITEQLVSSKNNHN